MQVHDVSWLQGKLKAHKEDLTHPVHADAVHGKEGCASLICTACNRILNVNLVLPILHRLQASCGGCSCANNQMHFVTHSITYVRTPSHTPSSIRHARTPSYHIIRMQGHQAACRYHGPSRQCQGASVWCGFHERCGQALDLVLGHPRLQNECTWLSSPTPLAQECCSPFMLHATPDDMWNREKLPHQELDSNLIRIATMHVSFKVISAACCTHI